MRLSDVCNRFTNEHRVRWPIPDRDQVEHRLTASLQLRLRDDLPGQALDRAPCLPGRSDRDLRGPAPPTSGLVDRRRARRSTSDVLRRPRRRSRAAAIQGPSPTGPRQRRRSRRPGTPSRGGLPPRSATRTAHEHHRGPPRSPRRPTELTSSRWCDGVEPHPPGRPRPRVTPPGRPIRRLCRPRRAPAGASRDSPDQGFAPTRPARTPFVAGPTRPRLDTAAGLDPTSPRPRPRERAPLRPAPDTPRGVSTREPPATPDGKKRHQAPASAGVPQSGDVIPGASRGRCAADHAPARSDDTTARAARRPGQGPPPPMPREGHTRSAAPRVPSVEEPPTWDAGWARSTATGLAPGFVTYGRRFSTGLSTSCGEPAAPFSPARTAAFDGPPAEPARPAPREGRAPEDQPSLRYRRAAPSRLLRSEGSAA